MVWKTHRGLACALCLLAIVQALVPTGKLIVGKILIDSIVKVSVSRANLPAEALWALTLLAVLSAIGATASYCAQTVTSLLGKQVAHNLSVALLRQAMALDLSYFDRGEFYDKLQRAERDGAHRPVAIVTLLVQTTQHAVALSAMAIVLLRVRWWALALLAIATLPQFVTQIRFARRSYELLRRRTPAAREQAYYAHVLTSMDYVKEIKVFNAGQYLLDLYQRLFRQVYAEERHMTIVANATGSLASVAASLSYVAFYGYLLSRAGVGGITVGEVVLYGGAYLQSQADLGSLLRGASGLYEHTLFIANVWEYLSLRTTLPGLATRPRLPRVGEEGLSFRGVSFKYPGTDTWALRDLNIRIRPGECVALVGANGAGKSSLVKLLCRLYDPHEGEILLDGQDIKEVPLEEYRDLVAALFQDFGRYHMSARMNIAMSAIDDRHDLGRIREAARCSGASRIIERWDGTYDAVLGNYFEGGHQLSVGEWQKVALARTMMRRDCRVLVLDEPMAALDPESEEELLQSVSQFSAGRLTLFVSHRLSSASIAHRVVLLDAGRVAESGTHAELLRLGGRYASLFSLQASRYVAPQRRWESG